MTVETWHTYNHMLKLYASEDLISNFRLAEMDGLLSPQRMASLFQQSDWPFIEWFTENLFLFFVFFLSLSCFKEYNKHCNYNHCNIATIMAKIKYVVSEHNAIGVNVGLK